MSNLESKMLFLQEKQIELIQEYVDLWNKWIKNVSLSSGEIMSEMNLIREKIEHLSMGIQFSSIVEKINEENNIIVPKNNIILQ